MRCVYVAGKYRDESAWLIEQNIRRAEEAGLEIWRMGAAAVVPHALSRFYQGAAPDHVWLNGMLEIMRRCDAVYLLSSWKESQGSIAEADEAVRLGIPVFQTLEKLEGWLRNGSIDTHARGYHSAEAKLYKIEELLESKKVFIIFVDMDGSWKVLHSACSVAEICLSGVYLQQMAVNAGVQASVKAENP